MFRKNIWIKISLINLLIVALLGVVMRYKIGFSFPYFDQKNLQHAHSHFAFYGWVTHSLMGWMVMYIDQLQQGIRLKKYHWFAILNLLCSYGMLIAFTAMGYHPVSIAFSTLAILISYFFTYSFLRDFRHVQIRSGVSLWFRAALVFNALASLGTFYLAWMMISRHISQEAYLASVYFYLHFMYNGWFFFACMGLAILYLRQFNPEFKTSLPVFWMFACSAIPAYLLSALWLKVPSWVYPVVVVASVVQLLAWWLIVYQFRKVIRTLGSQIGVWAKGLLGILAMALSIKFMLQLGSVIPAVSKLAFGFRPIIIAYLHLVLLGVISVFLLTYLFTGKLQPDLLNKISKYGLGTFVLGIYLTEIVLAVQGIASFAYFAIPLVNETLFALAIFMLAGILLLLAGIFRLASK